VRGKEIVHHLTEKLLLRSADLFGQSIE